MDWVNSPWIEMQGERGKTHMSKMFSWTLIQLHITERRNFMMIGEFIQVTPFSSSIDETKGEHFMKIRPKVTLSPQWDSFFWPALCTESLHGIYCCQVLLTCSLNEHVLSCINTLCQHLLCCKSHAVSVAYLYTNLRLPIQ